MKAMSEFTKGSEWRIWDLHFHTPSSYDYTNKGVTNQLIIETLHRNNVSVVAVTDHHIIDIPRIQDLQRLGKGVGITVLPGIEFCSELGGSESVHYIGIFPENANLSMIWTKIQGQCGITSEEVQARGQERICCAIQKTCDLIVELGGIVTIHAGKKSNSIESIKNTILVKQELKQQLLSTYTPLLEIGKIEDISSYKEHVFPDIKFSLPIIMCSDNHNIEEYCVKFPMWIKADPTFEGLKQVLYEPSDRVKIQKDNPSYEIEKYPFTEIIVPNKTQVFAEDTDISFAEMQLPLNSNLVSIIGGRGTGKSVLINYLAAAFHKHNHSELFNLKNSDIVIRRRASVAEEPKNFKVADNPNVPFIYIAQSQIKELVQDKKRFSQNIRETIGVSDEYEMSSEYLLKAENAVNEYFRIVEIINADGTTSEDKLNAIEYDIKRYKDFIENITSEQNKEKLEGYKGKLDRLNSVNNWIKNVQQVILRINAFAQETNEIIVEWNSKFNKMWQLNIPSISTSNTTEYLSSNLLALLNRERDNIQKEIDDTHNEFKDYKGDLTSLLSNVSIYQNKVSSLEKQKETIIAEVDKYGRVTSNLFKELGRNIKDSVEAYAHLVENKWLEFKGENDEENIKKRELLSLILQENLDVAVEIHFDEKKMYSLLLEKLDGRSYNEEKLSKILQLKTIEDFYSFITQSSEHNIFNPKIKDDLRGRLLELFFKKYTSFITHNINVTLSGKPITKLSFGQQGTIYLRLQIAANLFSETIIYDQPEDDLDNDFITRELIDIFKTIKQYRQIIIVSHNANLVVNADSEQIIVAQNNDGVLSYLSGALENPKINELVCRILEGGKQAFENREKKYQN